MRWVIFDWAYLAEKEKQIIYASKSIAHYFSQQKDNYPIKSWKKKCKILKSFPTHCTSQEDGFCPITFDSESGVVEMEMGAVEKNIFSDGCNEIWEAALIIVWTASIG